MKLDSSHLDHEPKLVHLIHALAAQEPGVWSDTHIWILVHMYHKICKKTVFWLKYARGDCWAVWPWFRSSEGPSQQGKKDDRSHSGRMCEIGDRCWMASSRVLITYLIFQIGQCEQAVLIRSTKRVYEMSELKLSMKIQVWQSIEFCMNSMKLFFFFEMIDSCLIELRKRNPLRRTTFKLFRTFKWAVANSHSLHWRGVVSLAKFS